MTRLTRRTLLAAGTAALATPAILRAQTPALVIGAPLPITGGLAPDGAKQQRGYSFWLDTVTKAGGIDVGGAKILPQVIFSDYQSNTPRAVQAADQLITQQKCNVLFGPLGSGATKASSSVAERYKVPLVAPSASSREVYDQGYKYLFGTFTPNDTLTTPLVEIVRKQAPDVDSVAILARNDLFPLAIAQEMEKAASKHGLTVTGFDKYAIGTMDHASAISAMAAAKPKWVFATGYVNDLMLIRRQMDELKLTAPVITMLAGPAYREFREELGPLAENVTTASWWAPAAGYTGCQGPWASTDDFVKAYQAALGVVPDYGEASAVACGVAVQLAAQAAGSTDPQALRDALAKLNVPTFFGPLRFGPDGQETALKPPVLQIQDGKLVVLYPPEIKQADFRRV
jgi:branched-chain amino acid transport system substrate-binding protein